jgi:hypothetical protein
LAESLRRDFILGPFYVTHTGEDRLNGFH